MREGVRVGGGAGSERTGDRALACVSAPSPRLLYASERSADGRSGARSGSSRGVRSGLREGSSRGVRSGLREGSTSLAVRGLAQGNANLGTGGCCCDWMGGHWAATVAQAGPRGHEISRLEISRGCPPRDMSTGTALSCAGECSSSPEEEVSSREESSSQSTAPSSSSSPSITICAASAGSEDPIPAEAEDPIPAEAEDPIPAAAPEAERPCPRGAAIEEPRADALQRGGVPGATAAAAVTRAAAARSCAATRSCAAARSCEKRRRLRRSGRH